MNIPGWKDYDYQFLMGGGWVHVTPWAKLEPSFRSTDDGYPPSLWLKVYLHPDQDDVYTEWFISTSVADATEALARIAVVMGLIQADYQARTS